MVKTRKKQMQNPKISIIIPIYNTCKNHNSDVYLCKNIESVINQTYENIEILYVDNNSIDESVAIVESYNNPKIKILRQPLQGVSNARNLGIQNAQGEYFTFIDSDDYVSFDYIESAVKEIENADILIREFLCCDKRRKPYKSLRTKAVKLYGNDIKNIYPFIECPHNIFFKTSLIKENNILQNSDIKVGEDNLFNVEAILKAEKIKITKTANYYYQVLDNSSSNVFSDKYITFIKAYEKIFKMGLIKYGCINNACVKYFLTKYKPFYKLSLDKDEYKREFIRLLNKYSNYYKLKYRTKRKMNRLLKDGLAIDSEIVSVIIKQTTNDKSVEKCLKNIKKYLPNAEILFLNHEDVIKKSNGKYILIINSDVLLKSTKFLKYYTKYNAYDKKWHFITNRVLISSFNGKNSLFKDGSFINDWQIIFGLKEDIAKLLDVSYLSDKEEILNIIANNFIVLSSMQFDFKISKNHIKNKNFTHKKWLKIYNKYADGNEKIPLFDFW